jgi:DNA-binding MarR family transcriptional regulator
MVFADPAFGVLRAVTLIAAKRSLSKITTRQLATFLQVYMTPDESTVRGVAKHLRISKPAVTRAFDRLCERKLLVRKPDPHDKRSVLAGRTPEGARFLSEIRAAVSSSSASSGVTDDSGKRLRATPSLAVSRTAEDAESSPSQRPRAA